ncbi:S24 family peptidase [Sphingobacterium sp. UBA6320]|jgi:hypothetical protein|uniref:S24 family peptidase n=1 Tax=Sphingobacterium sp. UBA6320 TaxID=1947510 RepID=UPI0025CDFF03|nr:S24 family peptidase [Sphingobacterium sp. UBA6320]
MTSWERLEQIIEHLGLNVNSFAKAIGLNRSERLYQIKKGNYTISKNLSAIISKKFPEINEGWLLTGNGSMLESSILLKKIPLYSVSLEDLPEDMHNLTPTEELDIPILSGSDFAIVNNGDAMSPEIVNGSVVFVRRVDMDAVLYGNIYLIVSEKFNVIRFVREYNDEVWRLVAKNVKDFDDILLKKSSVQNIYKVKGVLSLMSM